jgi:hypothetical protein
MTGAFVAGSPAVGESRSAKPSTEFGIHGAASGFWLPTAPLGFPFHRSNGCQRFSKAQRTAKSFAMVSEVLPSASSELSAATQLRFSCEVVRTPETAWAPMRRMSGLTLKSAAVIGR